MLQHEIYYFLPIHQQNEELSANSPSETKTHLLQLRISIHFMINNKKKFFLKRNNNQTKKSVLCRRTIINKKSKFSPFFS